MCAVLPAAAVPEESVAKQLVRLAEQSSEAEDWMRSPAHHAQEIVNTPGASG